MPLESKQPTTNHRYLVIYNPSSGRFWDRRAIKKTVSQFQKKEISYDIVTIDTRDKQETYWQKIHSLIAATKLLRIIVIGGDGTLRRVFEFMVQHDIDVEVGFIPSGTANVVAHSLKIPRRPSAALQKILDGQARQLDLGQVNDTYIFFIAACFGKIADVAITHNKYEKKLIGRFAYLKNVLKMFWNFKRYPFELRRQARCKQITAAHSVLICNHLNMYPWLPSRPVRPDDGRLNLFLLKGITVINLVQSVIEFFTIKKNTRVLEHMPIQEVELVGQDFDKKVHLDGDSVKLTSDVIKVKVLPQRAKFIL